MSRLIVSRDLAFYPLWNLLNNTISIPKDEAESFFLPGFPPSTSSNCPEGILDIFDCLEFASLVGLSLAAARPLEVTQPGGARE